MIEPPNHPLRAERFDRPPRPRPVTVDQKLDEIIKRLGRIEKHAIDLKGNPPPPGQLRYQRDVDSF